MTETIALASPENPKIVRCWCTFERKPDGSMRIDVLNGAWQGIFYPDKNIIQMDEMWKGKPSTSVPAILVWEGEVPRPHGRDYNTAIPWINEQLQKEV